MDRRDKTNNNYLSSVVLRSLDWVIASGNGTFILSDFLGPSILFSYCDLGSRSQREDVSHSHSRLNAWSWKLFCKPKRYYGVTKTVNTVH
jgi:hypothetical protein